MDFEIRPLTTHDQRLACVELQRETWGRDFTELVPPSLLYAVQHVGGVAAGAFAPSGTMLGFVFGFTGTEGGRLVHWSDMVAVRADAQGRGIGRALKEYQRDAVARLGVTVMYWTYDPLVSKNAHLNFNHYGVRVVEYVQDPYGSDTRSTLHRGVGTDRFVVAWPIAAPEPSDGGWGGLPGDVPVAWRGAPIVNGGTAGGAECRPERLGPEPPSALRVEIPRDIARVQASSLDLAARWRASTRRAFVWCLAHGYAVAGFVRDDAADRGYYLLTHP
jgi:predicted GNAT superfamily acetyltransferase